MSRTAHCASIQRYFKAEKTKLFSDIYIQRQTKKDKPYKIIENRKHIP